MPERKYMPIQEFMDEGYLHELNRKFLHPHGLALEVSGSDKKGWRIGGVWDYRDDPEGMSFAADTLDPDKAQRVADVESARQPERVKRLGYWIQPV